MSHRDGMLQAQGQQSRPALRGLGTGAFLRHAQYSVRQLRSPCPSVPSWDAQAWVVAKTHAPCLFWNIVTGQGISTQHLRTKGSAGGTKMTVPCRARVTRVPSRRAGSPWTGEPTSGPSAPCSTRYSRACERFDGEDIADTLDPKILRQVWQDLELGGRR